MNWNLIGIQPNEIKTGINGLTTRMTVLPSVVNPIGGFWVVPIRMKMDGQIPMMHFLMTIHSGLIKTVMDSEIIQKVRKAMHAPKNMEQAHFPY